MKPPRNIPGEVLDRQSEASHPGRSVWVSANAGSGKTHVLAQRVVRLLLDGTEPSKVLCLTYTRAAAANMSNRVFKVLSGWIALDDAALGQAIAGIEGRAPGPAKLKRARQLFAEALETPGGLKIQTIHAFCEAILHQFPLEANIAGHFEMLDGPMEAALFAEARRTMIAAAVAADDRELAEAFGTVLARGGEFGLDALLGDILRRRDGLRAFLDQTGGTPGLDVLLAEFGFQPGDTAASIAASVWPVPGFSPGEYSAFVANAEATDAASVLKFITPYASLAYRETDPQRRLTLLVQGFLKADGAPYGEKTFKKALLARMPDLLDRYTAAADAIIAVADRAALFEMLDATRAALTVADRMIGQYERLKSARGFLDFNDLINRTVRLLMRPDAGPWVHFKLDQGIDHILLDEAQDTSPDQWKVVRQLAEEFFTGLGARDNVTRTIFAVGDEKQSIYSFQGADPAGFDDSRLAFSAKAAAANAEFVNVKLDWSFRSTDDVLSAIDTVFASDPARTGLTRDPAPIAHKAIRDSQPGYVELWPSIAPDAIEEPDDWRVAVDHASAPAVRLADHIARSIKAWISDGEVLEGVGRRVTPGDILVLVRKRDRFIHALSRSLKDLNIAVAGADRLSLRGHIAVKDMMALGRFIVQPDDDLSLATVLRSPIFGLTDEQLYAVAAGRGNGRSLFASLRQLKDSDPAFGPVIERLEAWRNDAAFRPVFEFYAAVLGRDGVRARMIARLGDDAGDILDEFLSFCLAEEKAGLPGLDAFLYTLEHAAPEIRREMDQSRDEVRIMTTHAAKGLEAPVVFLVDSGSAPFSEQHLPRLLPITSEKGLWTDNGYLWRSGSDVANGFSQEAQRRIRDKAEEEYRRLLYVGLTRAEDRLIVCGYHGKRTPLATNWHGLVETALRPSPHTAEYVHPILDLPVLRYRVSKAAAPAVPAATLAAPIAASLGLPDWLLAKLPPAPKLPRPLSPSGASALIEPALVAAPVLTSPVLDAEDEPSFAIARGLAIHRLMQVLPGLATVERRGAAERYLARSGSAWDTAQRQAALDSVMAILDDHAFAPIFAAGSRAEVAVTGRLTVGGFDRTVSGKIDRLAVTPSKVLIVDYKTNRPPPVDLAGVAEGYVTQLALYRALLQPLYPGREIAAGLLFTEAPRLIEVPAEAMQAALARLTEA